MMFGFMKSKRLMMTIFLIFLCQQIVSASVYEMPDSSRSRERDRTTKTRIPKDEQVEKYVNQSEAEDVSCFSSCLTGALNSLFDLILESIFTSSSERDTVKQNSNSRLDKIDFDTLIVEENGNQIDTTHEQQVQKNNLLTDYEVVLPDIHDGLYWGATIGAAGLGLQDNHEYQASGINLKINGIYFLNNFEFSLGIAYSAISSKAKYDYLTTTDFANGDREEFYDLLNTTNVRITSPYFGITYYFGSKDFLQNQLLVGLGLYLEYTFITESADVKREVYFNNQFIENRIFEDKISFSQFNPAFVFPIIFRLGIEKETHIVILMKYSFLSRTPNYQHSLPIDWDKLEGLFSLSFGVNLAL
ncbi:MAG TPA: hypothetical protein PK559_02100 [Ignavibacteriaceae bacterium]|nr:hypothetical protein [Ignavibacteriaceae bacterium]